MCTCTYISSRDSEIIKLNTNTYYTLHIGCMHVLMVDYMIVFLFSSSDPSLSVHFHITFLQLLVMLAAEPDIMNSKVIRRKRIILCLFLNLLYARSLMSLN